MEDWQSRQAEAGERQAAYERAKFEQVLRNGTSTSLAAHQVEHGDALFCTDEVWRPVLASFPENASSGTTTLWVIMCLVPGEPTWRWAGSPSADLPIKRIERR